MGGTLRRPRRSKAGFSYKERGGATEAYVPHKHEKAVQLSSALLPCMRRLALVKLQHGGKTRFTHFELPWSTRMTVGSDPIRSSATLDGRMCGV